MKKNSFIRQALDKINPYIPGQSIEEIKEKHGLKDVVKLASNENPLGVAPSALKILPKEIWNLNYYPLSEAPQLKQKLAERLGVAQNQLLVGNGSDEIMSLAALAFLNPAEKALVPFPSFQTYEIVTRMMAAEIVKISFVNYRYDLQAFLEKIDSRVKVIFLCSPNNHTGVIFRQDQWREFIQEVPEDVLVVVDEAYHEYVTDREYPKTILDIASGKSVLILRTFSKIYGLAGLRVGYGISRPEIIEALRKVRLPFSVNYLAQKAAWAALDDERFVEESLTVNESGKKYLSAQLRSLGLNFIKTEANFIFIEVEMNAQTLAEEMSRLGVIVRPLNGFGMSKAIRVTIGKPEQNERFILALTQCLDWLR